MSWSDVDNAGKATEENKKKASVKRQHDAEIARKFSRVFNSEDGKVVFEHLFQRFIMSNETPLNAANVEYEAGYHAGEAGVVKYITHQISRAKEL